MVFEALLCVVFVTSHGVAKTKARRQTTWLVWAHILRLPLPSQPANLGL